MQVDEASVALPSVPLHLYKGTFGAEFFSPRHTFSEKSKILHKEVSLVLMLRRKLTYTVQRIPLPLRPLYVILTFCAKTSGRHLILSEKNLSGYVCYGAGAVAAAQMRVSGKCRLSCYSRLSLLLKLTYKTGIFPIFLHLPSVIFCCRRHIRARFRIVTCILW